MPFVSRLFVSLCCALTIVPAWPSDTSPSDPVETLAASAPRATPSGHRFTAPEGFTLSTRGPAVVMRPPEGDSTIAIVDIAAASDADDAVAKGWEVVAPGSVRKLKLATPRPNRNGWTDQRYYDYETSPNEKRTVFAIARRSTTGQGSPWVAVLVDASDATMEKRGSPLGQMFSTLRPLGYSRESLAGRVPHPLDAERIETLKRFVADGMKRLDVPGVGLSFIDGNQVVYEGGLGVKTRGRSEPIDARTLFIAASNTKAMTTLLLAQAVDADKLHWDEPVVAADPAFRVDDPDLTRRVLVRNLVCACTGMPRQDLDWLFDFKGKSAASTFDTLGRMKPTSAFGEVFQYSNLMAAAAGYIGAAAFLPGIEVGAAYDRSMHDRIFAPLGMNDTTFDFARVARSDHASPHGDTVDGGTQLMPMELNRAIVSARPAGGLWTSPHDFSRFVLMELSKGRTVDGERIVSEENLLERRKPQILVGEDVQYGMGLFVDKHLDIEIVHHGGDLFGYHSDMIWLPAYGIGATILTNSDSGVYLRGPLLRKMLEVLFDAKPEADDQLTASIDNRLAGIRKERERLVIPAARDATKDLARRYANPTLGGIAVSTRGDALTFAFKDWRSRMASRQNDDGTTSFITIDPGIVGVEFVVGMNDGKRTLVLRDSQHEYVFAEAVPAASR